MSDTPASTDAIVPSPKPLTLPQITIEYLRQLVNSTTWATTLFNIRFGGEAFEALPEPDVPPMLKQNATADEIRAHRVASKEWAAQPVQIILNSKQRRAVKACLEHYYPKGALPPGKHTDTLLAAFGISYFVKEDESED